MDNIIENKIRTYLKEPQTQILLENNDLYNVYLNFTNNVNIFYKLTQFFLNAGVNPLNYMDTVVSGMYSDMSLNYIEIPSNIKRIGSVAFDNCTNLSNVNISDGVELINYRAFKDCVSLTNITIPQSVKILGYECFSNCTNLKSVKILSDNIEIEDDVFIRCNDDLTIYCHKDSSSHRFAEEQGLLYEII